MPSTVALGWMASFSCAGKVEQAIVATMIPGRSELRFKSGRSGAFQSDLRANNDPTSALPGGFGTGRIPLESEAMGVAENLERVRGQITQAAAKAGRSANDVELVAITKTHPAEKVREAVDAGHTLFGESRVQEARTKIPELPSNLRWHFVGHLQKNKVRQALPLFELFHGVDSLALAQEMNRIAAEEGAHPCVLLEVNVAEEGSKFGFKNETLRAEMESLLALPRLSIEGLMCVPPLADEAEASRKFFARLRELRDSLEEEFDLKLPRLSMGMTQDFWIAVEEGATLVRVGTAIFGKRSKRPKQ